MHAAVFVDFENFFHSLRNRDDYTGIRIRDLCLQMLENLKTRLQSQDCPMVLGRSYAAFDAYPGMEVAHDLALMGLDPQYVLVGHAGKNSADVQLAVDACRVLFRRPDIDMIVIVSGDRDFIPLARQVLEENRELRVVGIPDTTSGDLRMRVGANRFWNALELLPARPASAPRTTIVEAPAVVVEPASSVDGVVVEPAAENSNGNGTSNGTSNGTTNGSKSDDKPHDSERSKPRAAVVGHIPVTWRTNEDAGFAPDDERLGLVLDLLVRAQVRHGSREIWLSPFLKGPMSQHFSGLVHPERRALVNELRNRGVIRIEERENMFADHPYSVIVVDEAHPLAQSALERHKKSPREA